jgi:hypothetical protein
VSTAVYMCAQKRACRGYTPENNSGIPGTLALGKDSKDIPISKNTRAVPLNICG